MDLEKQMIEAFSRVVHQEHPNQARSGCPDRLALQHLSGSEPHGSLEILAHVRSCAAYLDELKKLRT
jgi:hypothetical protein